MRHLIAIDPGPVQSGYVYMQDEQIIERGIIPNEQFCGLFQRIEHDDEKSNCVIEQIASYGMAVGASVFETCFWSGRFAESAAHNGFHIYRIPRMKVKMHLCHSPRASNSNIRQALIDRFGPPGTKIDPGKLYGIKKHIWAALALAITAMDMEREEHE